MTSYAADPHASAVYLYREEGADDNLNMHYQYARVKILTEKGKEMFSDIEIAYESSRSSITDISGRTIHSDGSIIPFSGKPYDKLLTKQEGEREMSKVFSMPDVQVGSIIEYRFKLRYDTDWYLPPTWQIQQQVPVLKASYHFVPGRREQHLLYTFILPPGDRVTQQRNGSYELNVKDVPALPHGDYLPPFADLSYRLEFYYSSYTTTADYWKQMGDYWSKGFDKFAHPTEKIRAAVNGIVAAGDSDDQKVQKIYAAIMKLENTSFTREHSAKENKAEHLKVKNAEDIWAQQRGNDDEITGLFVAMIRAAGLHAYGAIVADRDENVFQPGYLTWDQLNDDLAIVSLDGKELYFDPGQRYCEFGKLHWKHTSAGGLRQSDGGTKIFTTPPPRYEDNDTERSGQLTLDADGQVHGVVNETMTGAEALFWRQAALIEDESGVKKLFEDSLQS
ncbi:MAG TPA: DUF3857 domain-containing protein [Silvibacterium sp.]|nr:DUF3857 domain-containing protein [Silvibacterium sp.]